ncbi:MAG: MG2 domain-containing protein [Bacteroidales bacterium]|nr:MG2 domain-containing protein [Bacteroidales bacterium]
MKHILSILCCMVLTLSLSAQSTLFEKNIQKAEKQLNDGFPNDAEKLLDSTLQIMRCNDNVPLFVKANILYITAISAYQEDAIPKSIRHLETVVTQCQSPATEIFHSYLGELYDRFRVSENRKTDVENDNDLTTWSAEHLQQQSLMHYRMSLKNVGVSQQQLIEKYKIILTDENNRMNLMPTLYDVLAMRFFEACQHRISIEWQPELLLPLNEFLKINVEPDTTFSTSLAVSEFQRLLHFHLNRSHPVMTVMYPKDALIYFDIFRLRFFDENNQNIDLRIKALDYLMETFKNESAVTLAYFEKAQLLNDLPYSSETGENRWSKVEAMEVCRAAVALFPDSEGAKNCAELMKLIQEKEVAVRVETEIPVQRPALMNVRYQNIKTLNFKVFQLNDMEIESCITLGLYHNESIYQNIISQSSPILSWAESLLEQTDFREHSTEVELPPLASGYYLIFSSLSSELNPNTEYSVATVQVSDMLPMLLQQNDEQRNLVVVNRVSGHPLKDVQITYYQRSNEMLKPCGSSKTDENGWTVLPKMEEIRSVYVQLKSGNDVYWSESAYLYGNHADAKEKIVTDLFTDRSIYRPGQTVYYKGIVYQRSIESIHVMPHQSATLVVRDANYQEIFNKEVTSDDFGSFHGSFVLPNHLLNGTLSLHANDAYQTIRVEEYKRPRFEVTMETPTTELALNDTIEIHGKSMMLNGLPLQKATVRYSVNRSCFRPWRFFFFDVQKEEIFSGTTEAQDDGTFLMPFVAKSASNDNGKCFYRFTISAEVVDMTGEVQQAETNVFIGKEPLNVRLSVDDFVVLSENDQVRFDIQNTEDHSLPMAATLAVEKLESSSKIFTDRQWEFPDTLLWTRKEFEQKFPNFCYEKSNQRKGKEIFRQEFAADAARIFDLSSLNPVSGNYRITVSTVNQWGDTIQQQSEIQVLNKNDKKCNLATNALFYINRSSVEMGDTVTFYFCSGIKDAKMLYILTTSDGKSEQKWLNIGGKNGTIELPTGENLNNDFKVNAFIFRNNRCYQFSEQISVIDPTTKLKMEISGIRDKTQPGAKETWQVKISDNEGNPVSASMFSAMYDAALDHFEPHSWSFTPTKLAKNLSFNDAIFGLTSKQFQDFNKNYQFFNFEYFSPYSFQWFLFTFYRYGGGVYFDRIMASPQYSRNNKVAMPMMIEETTASDMEFNEEEDSRKETTTKPTIRQNFNETAFFYPDVRTNAAGELVLEFTMPETSTRWNMMGIAYTKSLQTVYYDTVIVTKSDFMVLPNIPRFLRSGDECRLTTRISNSSDQPLSGVATLHLENPVNGKSMNHCIADEIEKPFEVAAGQSITVSWMVKTTTETDLLQMVISAKCGDMTDGEKHIIPVLPNEAVALETVAIELSQSGTHSYTLENLGNADAVPQHLTIECTTNPIWYAIQSLPTLIERSFECTDYIFNSLYATILSGHILNSHPEIKQTFDIWRQNEPDALLSNLEQNQSLKNILLNETPWVNEAKDETARQQRLATMFDDNQLNYNKKTNLEKLQQRQTGNGAFIWFPEMGESWWITEYIVNGIGKLQSMQLDMPELVVMAEKAVQYLDAKMKETKTKYPESVKFHLNYLFARSYFMNVEMDDKTKDIFNEIKSYSIKNHTKLSFNERAKLALALQRIGATAEAKKIAVSLDNYGLGNQKTGKYWRTQQGNVMMSNITLSALMADIYKNILQDENSLKEVQKYLIRNKRTNEWMNATATADAVYALLLGDHRWQQDNSVTFRLGDVTISSKDEKTQAGSGYFKRSFSAAEIQPAMKNIEVETANDNLLMGGIYLQYQIPVDKIAKSTAEDLTVNKQLYVAQIENGKTVYKPINETTKLNVGEKVVVRLTMTSNRDMEYVHLNDMRSGSFEPVETISHYVWNSDLGYYFDIKDASVNLFFERVPRGTYVIEYELWATQSGTFSNGFSTIQCMYAPEFSGNSDGERLNIR